MYTLFSNMNQKIFINYNNKIFIFNTACERIGWFPYLSLYLNNGIPGRLPGTSRLLNEAPKLGWEEEEWDTPLGEGESSHPFFHPPYTSTERGVYVFMQTGGRMIYARTWMKTFNPQKCTANRDLPSQPPPSSRDFHFA